MEKKTDEEKRTELLNAARRLLADATPLRTDCGRICGKRCCASMEGEETGMLLFPGEEDFCGDGEGWRIIPAGKDLLLICPGACERENRPLACRMFPLLPRIGEDGSVSVRTDERARGVCPLTRQGPRGMDPRFTEAVRRAGELLAEDPEQKRFLLRLQEEQEELKTLRKKLMG